MARVSAGGAVGLASRGSAEARGWTIGWWWLHGWDGRLLGANLLGLELDVRSSPMSQLLLVVLEKEL